MAPRHLTVAIPFAAALIWGACNGSDFAGNADKAAKKSDKPENGGGKDGGDKDSVDALGKTAGDGNDGNGGVDGPGNGGNESGEDLGGVEGAGGNGGSGPGEDGANGGGGIGLDEGCLAKKADVYNIVIVLDASSSQEDNDPGNLRGDGAKDFTTTLAKFADKNPKVKVNVSAVGFNKTASRGAHGWVAMSGKNKASIDADITQITTNLAHGTHFMPALDEAMGLLKQTGATASNKRQRNYIVFMTDGEPNLEGTIEGTLFGGENLAAINANVDTVTKETGAAMIAIAAGAGIEGAGITTMQGMAKPDPGIVSAKHKGQYLRVATAADMQKLGELLSKAVSGCE